MSIENLVKLVTDDHNTARSICMDIPELWDRLNDEIMTYVLEELSTGTYDHNDIMRRATAWIAKQVIRVRPNVV